MEPINNTVYYLSCLYHVEDHQRAVAAVDTRERVADAAVGFADRAEVPRIGPKRQMFLRRGR